MQIEKLMLKDACPALFDAVSAHFQEMNRQELVTSLEKTPILSQALFGSPESFRFGVQPIPSLTPDEAKTVKFRDWENIGIDWAGGHVEIQLDNFGRIELFYLSKLPQIYQELLQFAGYIGPDFES